MLPVLRTGFRPWFLVAGIDAALLVPLWVAAWSGALVLPTALPGPVWHAHEMLLGFTSAVVAGFLLTAVRNWTGRPTLDGGPLAALVGVWLAGRVLEVVPVPPVVPAVVDGAFFVGLAVGIGRPLVAARDRRNLGFLAPVLALGALDAAVHLRPADGLLLLRGALDLVLAIVVVITSRIVPAFTGNALPDAVVRRRPAWDRAALAAVVVLALAEVAGQHALAGVAAAVGGVAVLRRAAGWGVGPALRVPLLAVLHVGHAWVGVGLLLRAADALGLGVPSSAATHALTVGAIGGLTLGMMARVSLGHTGRPLVASRADALGFTLVGAAAVVRIVAAVRPSTPILAVSAALFAAGFAVWTATAAPRLLAPRPDGRPG